MISPRILFDGDPTEAIKYVGLAKEFGRSTFGAGVISKVWRLGEGVQIRVMNNLQARVCKVWIQAGGGFVYQFIGSLDRMLRNVVYGDPIYGVERTIPHVYATLCSYQPAAGDTLQIKTTALFSSAEEDAESPPRWAYSGNPVEVDQHTKISPTYQPDGAGVHTSWGYDGQNLSVKPWLLSTFGQSSPCHALHRLSIGSVVSAELADITYDYPPTRFARTRGVHQGPETDWWRRGTLTKITSGERSRVFIIMVDIGHTFHAYPLGMREEEPIIWDRPGLFPNILSENIKSASLDWPEWVTLQSVGQAELDNGVSPTELRGRLQSLWQFSQRGDKAICIAAHRADAWQGSSIITSTGDLLERQEDTSGWVEVGFNLEITGDNPLDFTFSVELLESYDSRNGPSFPVEVGYLLKGNEVDAFDSRVVLEYTNYRGRTSYEGHLVMLPTLATVATVKVQDRVAKQWLALYDTQKDESDGGYDFSPSPASFFSVAPEEVVFGQMRFMTHIVSMDLRSLSFCLAATLRYSSRVLVGATPWLYAAQALFLELSAFGVVEQTESLGNPDLVDGVREMFSLTHEYPDLENMTVFSAGATLDYEKTIPDTPEAYTAEQLATQFADLRWHDGLGGDVAEPLGAASVSLRNVDRSYVGLIESGLFGAAQTIYTPEVFLKFDNFLAYHPGMVWYESGIEHGELSFAGYPYGAIYQAAVKYLTLEPLPNLHTKFSVHPTGSWAIWAGPFAANTVTIKGTAYSDVAAETYEQVVIDRIVAKTLKANGTVAIHESSHREAVNQAFGKALSAEDFYFDLRVSEHRLQLKPNSIEKGITQPYYFVWEDIPLGIGFTDRFMNYAQADLPGILLNTTLMFDFYNSNVVHDTYSAYTTFPTLRTTGVWAAY